MSWWSGARIVAERELREKIRARSFVVTTVVLLLIGLAAVIVPSLVNEDDSTTLALTGSTDGGLADALRGAAGAQGLDLRLERRADAEAAVRDGDADVGLVDGSGPGPARVIVEEELSDELGAVVRQGVAAARLRVGLDDAGVAPGVGERLLRPPEVAVDPLDTPDTGTDAERGIGVIVAVILYLAILVAGIQVANGVAQEKTSHIAEVLLARIRPSQLLAGKVMGIGLLGLGQLAAVAIPVLVAALAIDAVDLPSATGEAVAVGLLFFGVGYLLYSAAFAGLGALVARQEEVGSSTAPLQIVLLAGYLTAAFGAGQPDSGLVRILSLVPPLSPMVMPLRVATGVASWWEVVLAVVLCLALAWGLLVAGAVVYRRAMVRGGPKVTLRQVLRAS